MEVKNIKKIKREKPNKKWSYEEVTIILNYLQEAPVIEAPTARIFYKKLLERCKIDATWELLRWKVRHLKASFKKANDWRQSTGAGLLSSDAGTSSVEGKILQMCPFYHQLKEIFSEKNVDGDFVVVDTGNVVSMEDSMNESISESNTIVDPLHEIVEVVSSSPLEDFSKVNTAQKSSSTQTFVDLTQSASTSVQKKGKDFAEKLKKHAPKTSAAHLAAFQADRTEMLKIKLEWEKEKHGKEFALRERKLKVEEEKIKNEEKFKILQLEKEEKLKILQLEKEEKLKILQLEKEEKLKILELEKDERLKKYEIEMRYKFQLQK